MGCTQTKEVTDHKKEDKALSPSERDRLEKITSKVPIRKVYNLIKVLGTGGFGTVKLANMKTNLDNQVAIKIIDMHKVKNKQFMMLRELEIMKTLDHPNIIKFYEVYQDKDFFYICMEYCSGGELLDRITKKKYLKEREAAAIIKKVISAVNHMHKKGIVHRDLKPENILFSTNQNDSEIKIIDFGLSNKFQQTKLDTMVGTPYYVAPEILSQKPYDQSCDMWSVGVILYILLSGYPPFYGQNKNEVFYKITHSIYSLQTSEWQKISSSAKDLIKKLIEKNPKKRLTAQQALKHGWIENFDERSRRMSTVSTDTQQDKNVLNMLKHFQNSSKFKREVIKVFVNQINEKEIQVLKEVFQKIDRDQTGLIRLHELQQALNECEFFICEEEVKNLMKTISPEDDNGELSIRYSEFIAATLDSRQYLTNEKMKGLFNYFDSSNTGYITLEDLQEILKRNGQQMSIKEIKDMIQEVDPNNDGKISYQEFEQLMKGDVYAQLNINDLNQTTQDDLGKFMSPQDQEAQQQQINGENVENGQSNNQFPQFNSQQGQQ